MACAIRDCLCAAVCTGSFCRVANLAILGQLVCASLGSCFANLGSELLATILNLVCAMIIEVVAKNKNTKTKGTNTNTN